ncbi:MAG: HAD family hydrolase [Candidatus Roizmanbacteria bacterium]|nr:HAD family hydrolase [Candidatus Roizmanbacteria bacterium]
MAEIIHRELDPQKSSISLIIWDVDGTLYQSSPNLSEQYRNANKVLFKKWFPNRSEVELTQEFLQIKEQTKSSTQALSNMGCGSLVEVEQQLELYLDTKKSIQPNQDLVVFFSKLTDLYPARHWAVRNGFTVSTIERLSLIGFEKGQDGLFGPFEKVIGTFDTYQVAKPSQLIFADLLRMANVPAHKILSVGDRAEIELTPAKKLGMQTALITYGKPAEKNKDIDYIIQTPYDIESLMQ